MGGLAGAVQAQAVQRGQLAAHVLGAVAGAAMVAPAGHHQGGVAAEAEKLGAPFLGEIPLDLDIRIGSDGGVPIVVSKPDSPQAQAFQRLADQIIASEQYARAVQ